MVTKFGQNQSNVFKHSQLFYSVYPQFQQKLTFFILYVQKVAITFWSFFGVFKTLDSSFGRFRYHWYRCSFIKQSLLQCTILLDLTSGLTGARPWNAECHCVTSGVVGRLVDWMSTKA